MSVSTAGPAKGQPPGKQPHLLALAIRASTRFELFNVAVMLFFILITVLTLLTSWAGQNAALAMQASK